MPNPGFSDEELRRRVAVYRQNGLIVSASARALGIKRAAMQNTLRVAAEKGILKHEERHDRNYPAEEVSEARAAMAASFERKKRKGHWDKPLLHTLPDEPFMLTVLGDPHLDNDGSDTELFFEAWDRLGPGNYGLCVGDFFDNWRGNLAHLYSEQTVKPSAAWIVFADAMERQGRWLLAACSGNHDDRDQKPIDVVADVMRRHGVSYRTGGIRLALQCGGEYVTVAMRHKWRGNSMYSAAHAIKRAASGGATDDVMIGGHIHQDEQRMHIHPRTGEISHLCQVSAFKEFDTYADVQGYARNRISPVWYLVISPRLPKTSPDRVKVFWDYNMASAMLDAITGVDDAA